MSAVCPKCTHVLNLGDRGIAEYPELCPRCLSPLTDVIRRAGLKPASVDDDSRYGGRPLGTYRRTDPPRISGPEDFPSCLSLRPVEESAAGALGEFGHYQILGFLARGGMGAVFKARCMRTGAVSALKVPSSACLSDPDERRRFLQEATVAQKLAHPNICRVLEVGESGGRPYLALEFIDGLPLRKWVAKSRPTLNDVALMIAGLARAVHHAHDLGVLHRDIKPENIMVRAADRSPVLLDFGLAHDVNADIDATRTGLVAGTPAYMAPEYAFGARASAATDVYGLGAVLYELITGRPPYVGSAGEVLQALRDHPPPAPRELNYEIPAGLDKVCRKAIARRPEDRFESAEELGARVEDAVHGRLLDTTRLRAVQAPVRDSTPPIAPAPSAGRSGTARWALLTGCAAAAGALLAGLGWLLLSAS
jgi:serine/threonine-protein kinase